MNLSPRKALGGAAVTLALVGLMVAHGSQQRVAGTAVIGAPAQPAVTTIYQSPTGEIIDGNPFPYQHMSIQAADEAGSAPGTVFVTVDDGLTRSGKATAVPLDGAKRIDAAYDDPTRCEQIHGEQGVCWRFWQVTDTGTDQEVQVWTTWQGQSCVVIGTVNGTRATRTTCW